MKTSDREVRRLAGEQLGRDIPQFLVSEAQAPQRLLLQRREQILSLPDARRRDHQPFLVVAGRAHDRGSCPGSGRTAGPWRRCSARAASSSCDEQRPKARPRDRPRLRHQLAQARSQDELGDEVDEVALFAVIADLDDRGVRQLQRPGLAKKPRADPVPVALAARPQHPDRNRMAERAMHAAKHLAAEAARGRSDPGCRRSRAAPTEARRWRPPAARRRPRSPRRSPPCFATGPRGASRARARRPDPPRPAGPGATGSGAAPWTTGAPTGPSPHPGPSNGTRPVSISNRTTPRLYTSDRRSTDPAVSCSGDA